MAFDLGGKKGIGIACFFFFFILFHLLSLLTLVIHQESFDILNLVGCH